MEAERRIVRDVAGIVGLLIVMLGVVWAGYEGAKRQHQQDAALPDTTIFLPDGTPFCVSQAHVDSIVAEQDARFADAGADSLAEWMTATLYAAGDSLNRLNGCKPPVRP